MPQANANLPLTFACGLYDRMVPLYAGQIRPAGIDLDFLAIDSPREIFDRMAAAQAFGASEMSLSEVVTRIATRQCPFVAIPVFPSRVFRHGFITVNRKSVRSPKDLAGKRIGVPLYTQTAAVFMRGLLAEDYGVDLSGVQWVEGAINAAAPRGQQQRALAERPLGRRRDRRDPGHQPAGLDEDQPRCAAPVSGFSRRRAGLLPAHARLSDHAPGRDPARHL
jgi:4,5-dihydroxyphthalate decarboxylase